VAEDPAGRAPGATATPGRPGTGPVGTPAVAERLRPLFFPRRIVIAGLTPRPDAWGRLALGFLRAAGYDGEVLAWRPRHDDPEVRGIDSFADAGPVDLVLVAVPADAAIDVVAEAAGAAVGGAVVFSSGFAEDGPAGADRQRRLVDAAAGMPLLGPNCLGLVSGPGHVVASVSGFLTRPRHEGPVALVSQSGAIGFVLAEQLRRRGIGFSYYASTGNEAVVGVPDVVVGVAEIDANYPPQTEYVPEFYRPGDLNAPYYYHRWHYWSFHTSGANWLLGDGSVHFLTYAAAKTVLPAMATRSGGEVVPANW
jgi:hypothetical protein